MVYINLILKYWHDLNLNHIYVLLHMLNTARSVNFIVFEDRSKVWTMSCTEVLFHTFIWCWSFHLTSIWLFNSKTRQLRRDPHPSPSFLICFFPWTAVKVLPKSIPPCPKTESGLLNLTTIKDLITWIVTFPFLLLLLWKGSKTIMELGCCLPQLGETLAITDSACSGMPQYTYLFQMTKKCITSIYVKQGLF